MNINFGFSVSLSALWGVRLKLFVGRDVRDARVSRSVDGWRGTGLHRLLIIWLLAYGAMLTERARLIKYSRLQTEQKALPPAVTFIFHFAPYVFASLRPCRFLCFFYCFSYFSIFFKTHRINALSRRAGEVVFHRSVTGVPWRTGSVLDRAAVMIQS